MKKGVGLKNSGCMGSEGLGPQVQGDPNLSEFCRRLKLAKLCNFGSLSMFPLEGYYFDGHRPQ